MWKKGTPGRRQHGGKWMSHGAEERGAGAKRDETKEKRMADGGAKWRKGNRVVLPSSHHSFLPAAL